VLLRYDRSGLKNCEEVGRRLVFLPIHTGMRKESLEALTDFLNRYEPA
jgi:dTDP-4-amino-4,6-dideoxygalactose transaminase